MRLPVRKIVFFGALFVMGLGWITPAIAGGDERHAGTVMALEGDAGTFVLDELDANAIHRLLRIRVTPRTQLVLSERNRGAAAFDRPFEDTAIGLADLRVGDFVVIEVTRRAPRTATTVIVTHRGVSESGA